MEDKDFQKDLETIWQQMKTIYQKIHAYARYKFRKYWGDDKIGEMDPLPAHIFGNMWAQNWENTLPILLPFDNVSNSTILEEVNLALKEQVKLEIVSLVPLLIPIIFESVVSRIIYNIFSLTFSEI